MKKFIFKTAFLVVPFLISFLLFTQYGSVNKGDLIRTGCLIDNTSDYRKIFEVDYSQDLYFKKLSEVEGKEDFDILTIGDSFSQQDNIGYQNHLAKEGFKIVHYDGININDNPLESLYGIINGDILSKVNVKYVLLQSAERTFTLRGNRIIIERSTKLEDLQDNQIISSPEEQRPSLFSKSTVAFPLFNLLYLFNDNACFSPVYKTSLTKNLFSTGKRDLLFYYNELSNLRLNNDEKKVSILNNELNALNALLKEKAIKLIVLPSPDKYDLYFDYIEDIDNYLKPQFFNHLNIQDKEYIYINSKSLLTDALRTYSDVYFYDDSHWSPVATKLIAKEIGREIKRDNSHSKEMAIDE